MRIGHGYDIHRTQTGRKMILGGVEIQCGFGLEGHSDADCLSHAIADAILGSMGLPDIGHYFPNDDAGIEGIDSQKIIIQAVKEAAKLGYRVNNVDASLIAERPKIGPYLGAMKKRLSDSLGIDPSCIGIKATTNEEADDIGKGLAIAAHAVVLMIKSS
ncbi:MAG: 2-C-methyl-D-erythritol 2,4-cyclodiphosphate synthase [Opitutales bacterium]|nr:2-C-methyl-D-erythritol 2,4-cyclodiphosphate synthase [Opitutales bacterium]